MLIIRRRSKDVTGGPGSSVSIGQANLTVLRVHRNGDVSLGIEAPREIPVLRDDASVTVQASAQGKPHRD